MERPRLFVELCAGSAAVSLRLVGGPNANPILGYQGGKRGYARAILGVLGLRQGLGAHEVWLNDAGPFGAVWQVLVQPGKAEEVAAIIRGWKDEEPRALWERLKAEGWGELTEVGDVARWSWVQGHENPHGSALKPQYDQSLGYDWNQSAHSVWLASRVEAVARWLVCQHWSFSGKGPEKGYGGPGCPGGDWGEQRDKALGIERFNGLVLDAAQALATPCRAFHGSALDVPIPEDCEGVYCYIDPPYQDTTGYQHTLPREDVITLARRWSDAGAVVCISEAVHIEIEGWHHVEITSERKGQRRTFGGTREWLTLNRTPAWKPSHQPSLFGWDDTPDTGRR